MNGTAIILLLLLTSRPLFAAGLDKVMPEYYRLNLAFTDDPRKTSLDAAERLKKINPDQQPRLWVEIKLFTLNDSVVVTNELVTDYPMLQDFARRARAIGREEAALAAEFIEQDNRITLEKKADEDLYRANYLHYVQKAKDADSLWLACMLMRGLAFWEYNIGRTDLALAHGREALTLVQRLEPVPGLETMKTKNILAIILEFMREGEAAERLYQELIDGMKPYKFRYASSKILFNYGLLLARDHDPARVKRSEILMREALDAAHKLGESNLIAVCQKGLGASLSLLGQYEESNRYLRLAIEGLTNVIEQQVSIADAHRLIGKNLVELKQYREALAEFKEARIEQLEKDKSFNATLAEYTARAEAALGNMAEAYHQQARASELIAALQKEEKNADMSRLKVSLGLQLEEQRNMLLNRENELQKQQLKISYYAVGAAILLIGLLAFATWEARLIKRSHLRMKRMRKHMEEGIFSIGPHFRTEADIAPAIARLMGGVEESFDRLLQATRLSADEQQRIRAALEACLGEPAIAWDLNVGQLPHEWPMQEGNVWLSCDWQPAFDKNDDVSGILLVVRDITARRQLLARVEEASAQASRFDSRVQEILRVDRASALSYLQELEIALPRIKGTDPDQALRALHTLKGGARALGFRELAGAIHHAEDGIQLEELNDCSQEYLQILRKLGQVSNERGADAGSLSLQQMVAQSMPLLKENLRTVNIELGAIEVDDAVIHWDRAVYDRLAKILTHALNNSTDHGFVLPRLRGETIPDQVRLKISAALQGSHLQLFVRDNGVGLNLVRLEQLAVERNFQPATPEDLPDVLLLPGVTTAQTLSETSGRGVGLSAVQELCEEVSGQVKIRPNDEGPGAMLVAQLPLDHAGENAA